MHNQESLFYLPPKENKNQIEKTDIEYIQLHFLNTEKKAGGTNLLTVDIPTGDVVSLNFPEDGILFPQGIFASTVTNVAAVTLLTDKYSGPNLTTTNK